VHVFKARQWNCSYKRPTVAVLVETDEALKAGQAVEPRNEIQAMLDGGGVKGRFGME
jgi:hypothetical protein